MADATATPQEPLLEIKDVSVFFPIEKGVLKRVVGYVRAVDEVSLTIHRGKTLGLVGESGSGKTTLGHAILRAVNPTAGEILFHAGEESVDIASLSRREMREIRKHMQMIFQDPYSSLDPRKTVFDIVSEPLKINRLARGVALEQRVREVLELVGMDVKYMKRYPHAFSGGQRQRIGIARALSIHPDLIVCDEAVSALDVSVQAQILNLLKDLQDEFNLTYLFIAHDLSVVEHVSDEVAVMYVGKVVEQADTETLFRAPKHPYTEALLSAIPRPDEGGLEGGLPDPAHPPRGCYFHPRCKYAQQLCREQEPPLVEVGPNHVAACHFAAELNLEGM
jgi:peptide/nickel transport system ATP-binding protein